MNKDSTIERKDFQWIVELWLVSVAAVIKETLKDQLTELVGKVTLGKYYLL